MSRIVFGFLFFSLTTAITSQIEPSAMVAQVGEKKKKKGKNKEPVNPGELKEDTSRVLPVFDPGSHTKEISAMGFTKDKSKLITVGQDFTIQIWNAATGERVDILRLPGYGREKGFDPGRWDVAAVSTDGTRVAIGGQAKFLFDTETKENAPARLILVDIPNRKVARVQLAGNTSPVEGLVFSADGETLAVALAKGVEASARLFLVGGLTDRIAKANPLLRTADCTSITTPHSKPIIDLAFSPNGKQLVLGEYGQLITLWDVPAGAAPKPVVAKEIKAENDSASLNWSPDGKQFVCAWRSGRGSDKDRGIDLWSSDGKPVKSWNMPALSPALSLPASIREARFLDANSIYFVANGTTGDRKNSGSSGSIGSIACILDIASGKARRLTAWADGMIADPVGASTKDGELVALSVTGNTEVLIGRSQGERAFVRCGQRSPIPYIVGWAKAPEAPGFAWTNEYQSKGKERSPDDLRFGFDLTKVAPVGEIRSTDFDITRRKIGEWHFDDNHKKKKEADGRSGMLLKQGAKEVAHFLFPLNTAHTLIPNGDKPPLVAFKKNELNVTVRVLFLFNGDGKLITRLLPDATDFTDIASSPDGRYIIASTGSPRLVVYRTDGSPYPFLSFAQLNGEWVCWTPEGYYAASPGGEKMFGWALSNGPNKLVTFHPAQQFAKQFHRPDVIRLAVELGSVEAALKKLATAPADIEAILPPSATLKLVKQEGAKVQVQATASSGQKEKPILTMRLLLDGRPLPQGQGKMTVPPGKPAEATWDVEIPGGSHELKLLASSDDDSATSDPLVLIGPKNASQQPTLHRVCVGVNDYDDPGIKLNAAVKDAQEVFAAFASHCVGSANRFGTAKGQLLVNKEATRDAVLKALAEVRKAAKPGDLVVFFFAGHGVKQENEFYLLTKEADLNKSLKGISLSGDDLRKALSDIECPVLLIMDACHSAKGVKAFRPATDDLTRNLTDETAGVTILAAAMAHEVANASAENGHFTAALLKALNVGEGVPFDPYERALFTHHIYSVIFSEVRKATNGKQNPFLNSPWTVPPLAVREIPKQ